MNNTPISDHDKISFVLFFVGLFVLYLYVFFPSCRCDAEQHCRIFFSRRTATLKNHQARIMKIFLDLILVFLLGTMHFTAGSMFSRYFPLCSP